MLIKLLLIIIIIELAAIAWNTRKTKTTDLTISKAEFMKSLSEYIKESV